MDSTERVRKSRAKKKAMKTVLKEWMAVNAEHLPSDQVQKFYEILQ